jgi:hypothetical protein
LLRVIGHFRTVDSIPWCDVGRRFSEADLGSALRLFDETNDNHLRDGFFQDGGTTIEFRRTWLRWNYMWESNKIIGQSTQHCFTAYLLRWDGSSWVAMQRQDSPGFTVLSMKTLRKQKQQMTEQQNGFYLVPPHQRGSEGGSSLKRRRPDGAGADISPVANVAVNSAQQKVQCDAVSLEQLCTEPLAFDAQVGDGQDLFGSVDEGLRMLEAVAERIDPAATVIAPSFLFCYSVTSPLLFHHLPFRCSLDLLLFPRW